MNKTLIVLVGPTGIGKTKTSLEIAKYFNSEIVSCDSRQIYKELSIGTAVPSAIELGTIKHHFIHSHSIHDYYSASMFENEVLAFLEAKFIQHDTYLMVGGSMLYIDAVCNGIDNIPDVDPTLRQNLLDKFESEGIESLRLQLKQLDPAYYSTTDLKNPKRILRALEICLMTGKPYSGFMTRQKKERPFKIVKIGLNCSREILYRQINNRVDEMIQSGLIEEAKNVYPHKKLNALNAVGYKELFNFFDGNTTLEEAVSKIKQNTRNYAKKQITWFKKDKNINWFAPGENQKIIKLLKSSI